MKIAVPTSNGLLCSHFGHCEEFTIFDVNEDTKEILSNHALKAPEHEPGLLPRWLHGEGVELIIAGGMGSRAQSLFKDNGVCVIVGAPNEDPKAVVESYLNQSLVAGSNCCDH
ncbi:MAG: NifB/NifX family molybdenum-iron cluster-binding protein [Armatimonadota bacterium]